jgi:hypothetical protein
VNDIFFEPGFEFEDDDSEILESDNNPGCEECGDDATVKVGSKYDTVYLCDACEEMYGYLDDD